MQWAFFGPRPVPRLLGQASLKSGLSLASWPLDLGYSKLALHLDVSVSQGNISETLHFTFHPWGILSVLTLDKNTFNLLKVLLCNASTRFHIH